jgi:hypothetical protein
MDDADRVTVYSFWTFDRGFEAPILSPFKASRDAIVKIWRGKVAEGTAQVVLSSELDDSGRYRRLATGWGELA